MNSDHNNWRESLVEARPNARQAKRNLEDNHKKYK
jgi:hypothetical protein